MRMPCRRLCSACAPMLPPGGGCLSRRKWHMLNMRNTCYRALCRSHVWTPTQSLVVGGLSNSKNGFHWDLFCRTHVCFCQAVTCRPVRPRCPLASSIPSRLLVPVLRIVLHTEHEHSEGPATNTTLLKTASERVILSHM